LKDSGLDIPAIEALAVQMQEKAKGLDIDYILEETPGLIAESREGLDRIKKIVQDLKDFAHPGDDVLKLSDMNLNLDTTLNIVWNELKYKATVHKAYAADPPRIKCYRQQLNQVFMNILPSQLRPLKNKGKSGLSRANQTVLLKSSSATPDRAFRRQIFPEYSTRFSPPRKSAKERVWG
jgi:two-component system, NtrC family, sensor kinase